MLVWLMEVGFCAESAAVPAAAWYRNARLVRFRDATGELYQAALGPLDAPEMMIE
jgi:hypothetical protein